MSQSARYQHWKLETDNDGIAWLGIDKAGTGTNVLSRDLMLELHAIAESLAADPPRGLVIYSAKEGGFVAGADIHEFPEIRTAEEAAELAAGGQFIFARIEALPCPSVAVLNGTALGGGLELAMAATWRLGLPVETPCLGLPEVQLGLNPGFGGTVRAVRLMGARKGLDLMLTGRQLRMSEALRTGLIDRLSTAESWRADAVSLIGAGKPKRSVPLPDRLISLPPVRPYIARTLRRTVRAKARPEHYPAPYAMIDLWEENGALDNVAYSAEAQSLGRLAMTETSRSLVRVFFLQDRLKKLGGHQNTPPRHVHVVGAGVMGGDIAAWCALQGLTVTLQDRELKYVQPALERAAKLFAKKLRNAESESAARARLTADIEGRGVAAADVVIEAIFEQLEAKQALFRDVELRAPAHCLLATNTSSIPIEQIADGLHNPGRLVGLHFFNPVAKLPLVEIVRGVSSSADAMQAGLSFARQIGKLPVPCRSSPGFLVNRILAPYMAEAMTLAKEGVSLPEIDEAATSFGMPMGPVALADSVGLDVALHVARILSPVLKRPVAPEIEALVARGHLGQKTGRGFYVYQHGKPVKPVLRDHEVQPDVQDRLMLSFLNEAVQCLHEQIVDDADLADAGVIFGTGFAPFRGGPLHYAQSRGVDRIEQRLNELAAVHGERFRPSPGWRMLRAM